MSVFVGNNRFCMCFAGGGKNGNEMKRDEKVTQMTLIFDDAVIPSAMSYRIGNIRMHRSIF